MNSIEETYVSKQIHVTIRYQTRDVSRSTNSMDRHWWIFENTTKKMNRCYRGRRFVSVTFFSQLSQSISVFLHCTSNSFPHRKPPSMIKKHTSLSLLLLSRSQLSTHKVNQASHSSHQTSEHISQNLSIQRFSRLLSELEAILAVRGEIVERSAYNAKSISSTDDANDKFEVDAKVETKTNYSASRVRTRAHYSHLNVEEVISNVTWVEMNHSSYVLHRRKCRDELRSIV